MPKRQIFYSFHFSRDFWRVQQIRQMGVIEGNTPVSSNDWETVKRNGYLAIKNWIDNAMRYRSCVVILYGNETHSREWVQYEIEHGWNTGKGVLAIAIDRLEDQMVIRILKVRIRFQISFLILIQVKCDRKGLFLNMER